MTTHLLAQIDCLERKIPAVILKHLPDDDVEEHVSTFHLWPQIGRKDAGIKVVRNDDLHTDTLTDWGTNATYLGTPNFLKDNVVLCWQNFIMVGHNVCVVLVEDDAMINAQLATTPKLTNNRKNKMAIDFNALRQERDRLNNKSGFTDNFVTLPENSGQIVVRILPAAEGKNIPFASTRIHHLTMPDGSKVNVHCPKTPRGDGKGWEGICPICEHYNGLWSASKNTNDDSEVNRLQAEARSMKPVARWYYNVIVRKVVTEAKEVLHNVGPKILAVGIQAHQRILDALLGKPEIGLKELGDVTDYKTGRDFVLVKNVKKGPGNFPEYTQSFFMDPSPAGTPAEVAMWTEKLFDLGALIKKISVAEMEALVLKMQGKGVTYTADTSETSFNTAAFKSPVLLQAKTTVTDLDDQAVSDEEFLAQLKGAY